MKEEINVLIKEDEIVARVKELAEQINRDYEGKTLHLICILKGSVFFTCELAKYITDIVDSGRTLSYLAHMLEKRGPKSLRICTLLDKPACRVSEVDVAYTGFEIDDLFVVGFGLDYAQKYRNLPYIGELKIKED